MSSIQFSIATIAFETIAFVVFNTASAAEQPFAAPQVSQHVPVSTAGSLAQVTLSLLLVLAVVFAAAWIVRRIRGFGKFGPNIIQVIADAPLGTKERAVLIQVGGQQLLVGVTAGQVNLLHVLNEPVTPATPSGGGSMDPLRPEFKAILKRSLGLK
ncbi:MAG: flagellar biosynthetic protein FliO [Povalibacter sp.]